MPDLELNGKTYIVDEDGFLEDPGVWNEDVAKDFASIEGVDELTEEHWKMINYLRNYYLQFGIAPMIRKLCKETGIPAEQGLRTLPLRSGQGRLQARGPAQAHGVRVR